MKITQEEEVDRQTVLHIELDEEDLDPYLDRGYRRVAQRTAIPGFRKGKAPRRIIEQFLGREVLLNEVLDTMLPEVTGRAIDEQSIEAVGLPQIELLDLDPLTVKAVVPLVPDIDLGSYREIRVEEETTEVGEEDIQSRLEQLQHSMASWEPVQRPVVLGDMVTMKAKGVSDGNTFMEESDTVYFLDEDAVRPVPGFANELVDMELDTPKEFTIAVPEDADGNELAGKDAKFTVTISDIKERILPELDDEFAKGAGEGFDTFEALRERVEKDIKEEAQSASTQRHREKIIEEIMQGASIELAPVMIDHEVTHMADERANVLARMNVRADDYLRSINKTEDEMKEELREEAGQRIKRTFILSKLAEVEGLEVTEQDVEERIQSLLSDQSDGSEEPTITDEMRGSVERLLMGEKTMERLTEIAKGEAPPIAADSSSEAGSDEDKDVDEAVVTEAEKDDKGGE